MIDARLGILTGAAGEVGKAAARQFAESGWSLILCDRSDSVVAQGEALAKEFGRTVIGVKMDLLQDAEIERVVGLAQETGIPLTSCSRPRVAIALAASAGLRCCRCSREDESRSAGVALRRSPPPIDATGS